MIEHSLLKKYALDDLELRLAPAGYQLLRQPDRASLPPFAVQDERQFVPDAIAIGAKPHHWVEVVGSRERQRNQLDRLTQAIESEPDWTLTVLSPPQERTARLELVDLSMIQKQLSELEGLDRTHPSAALLYYWACLEALARARFPSRASQPVVLTMIPPLLVEEGYAAQDEGRRLRKLIDMRNRIAHGQLVPEPSQADVAFLSQIATRLLHEPVAA